MNKMRLVGFTKSGDSGTSTDGYYIKFLVLIKTFKFYIILLTLSSGYEIDSLNFKDHCFDTVRLYASLYPSYYMAQSVLIHGHDIIQQTLAIGLMSEEAQEARIKSLKIIAKISAEKQPEELQILINKLLVSSGLVISSLFKSISPQTNYKTFYSDVLQLKQSPPQ